MFVIQWMNFNGVWRNTEATFTSKKMADSALKMLGLVGSPAYRVKEH